jgi:hypothetical protein
MFDWDGQRIELKRLIRHRLRVISIIRTPWWSRKEILLSGENCLKPSRPAAAMAEKSFYMPWFSSSTCIGTASFAAAAFLLAGCGAINDAVNARIQPAVNLVGLDNQAVDVTIGGTGGILTGSGTREVSFEDRTLPEAGRLRFVRFNQSLQNSVTVTSPGGAPLPPQFSVSNLSLTLALRDDAPRRVSADAVKSGPITFVRLGETSEYRTSDNLAFSGLEIRSSFGTFRDIYTTAPGPNVSSVTLGLETAAGSLPAGARLRFTLTDGSAQFGV